MRVRQQRTFLKLPNIESSAMPRNLNKLRDMNGLTLQMMVMSIIQSLTMRYPKMRLRSLIGLTTMTLGLLAQALETTLD